MGGKISDLQICYEYFVFLIYITPPRRQDLWIRTVMIGLANHYTENSNTNPQ